MKDQQDQTDDMLQFFTRSSANEGVEFPLHDPSSNTPTKHWLRVLSVDSDAYQRANTIATRKAVEIGKVEDEQERESQIEEQSLNILTSLVIGWSFSHPCTPENVRRFLKEAPQIRNAVNRIAADRSLFINSSSQSSTDTLKPASDSTESQTDHQ